MLVELLSRTTQMPVVEATPGVRPAADHVYLVPPSSVMVLVAGRFSEGEPASPTLPIDAFLRSLAHEQQARAACVILSGHGSDGALGVEAIKGEGGITFAQDARSAKYDAMPLSAIDTGCVDYMLPPEGIAVRLGEIAARLGHRDAPSVAPATVSEADLEHVFGVLRAAHDLDFSQYRKSTIRRRILRRALLCHAESTAEYVAMLASRPLEIDALCQDILIRVTHFFRDPASFAALQREVFPALLRAREADAPIRIWVPGCATGEEAYSLAIAFLEVTAALGVKVPYQIFATDVSEEALAKARAGAYLENIAADVSPDRLDRHFTRAGKQLRIHEAIRDACTFARQDVTREPPFSRLDLISCRNVLLYFEVALQQRVVPMLHHALRPGGYLIVGASESAPPLSSRFTIVDREHRIYTMSRGWARPRVARPAEAPPARDAATPPFDLRAEADRLVMTRCAPPAAEESLRLAVEESEALHEELLSTNEELSISNEELSSLNEDLQTARDALESENEALQIRNRELEAQNAGLGRSHDDVVNLLGSVNLPLVMLDGEHRIRRFTPQAERLFDLIPSDVGRPLRDVAPRLEVPDLNALVADVIGSVSIRDHEVRAHDGRSYLMRLRPYRTADDRVDGAVIVLFDVVRQEHVATADEVSVGP